MWVCDVVCGCPHVCVCVRVCVCVSICMLVSVMYGGVCGCGRVCVCVCVCVSMCVCMCVCVRRGRFTGLHLDTGLVKCHDMDSVIFRTPRYANVQFNWCDYEHCLPLSKIAPVFPTILTRCKTY